MTEKKFMTNTKEYNEAVEKLALIILNARRIKEGMDKVESFAGFYEDDIEMNLFIAQTAIDALGIEIVSEESKKSSSKFIEIKTSDSEKGKKLIRKKDIIEVRQNGFTNCSVYVTDGIWSCEESFDDFTARLLNNKPAVYLENIKKNAGK